MLSAKVTFLHFTEAGFDSPPKKIPLEECIWLTLAQPWWQDLAIGEIPFTSGRLRCCIVGAEVHLPFFCFVLTVMVPEEKTSCFSNEVPSESV